MVNSRQSARRHRYSYRPWQEVEKDRERIKDIISKSRWEKAKMIVLATTMCKLITKREKALGRAEVSEEILGKDHPVTLIFRDKVRSM